MHRVTVIALVVALLGVACQAEKPVWSGTKAALLATMPTPFQGGLKTAQSTLQAILATKDSDYFNKEFKDRDWYYILQNIDSFPEYYTQIPALTRNYLEPYSFKHNGSHILDDYLLHYFEYSEDNLDKRLGDIYAQLVGDAAAYNPANDTVFKSKADVSERVYQFCPYNMLDGAWLRFATRAGPIDEVHSLLFKIWMDEMGDGDPSKSHPNLYNTLMESLGYYMPDIRSADFAYNPKMLDSAYTIGAFELAISQFSEKFFPEVLGMTLNLEWEVLALKPTVKMYDYWGVDSSFYSMHVAIDNAASGHGALAVRAVKLYMDQMRQLGGEEQVQEVWKRVWNGYITFTLIGNLGDDLANKIQHPPSNHDQMVAMIKRKAEYASKNHAGVQIGPHKLNDLFADPELLLKTLESSPMIDLVNPELSYIFDLMKFSGKMYGVFTPEEQQLWHNWVNEISAKHKGGNSGSGNGGHHAKPTKEEVATRMSQVINQLRPLQVNIRHHKKITLIGPDPKNPKEMTTQTIHWWFTQYASDLLLALANPENGRVVCGNAEKSSFTQLLAPSSPMGQHFNTEDRQAVVDWINYGCPIPDDKKGYARLRLHSSKKAFAQHPYGRIRGQGGVH